MTRIQGYVVVLEKDTREDDAEQILTALRMVRGVASVQPVEANLEAQVARLRVQTDVRKGLLAFYEGIGKETPPRGS